MEHVYDTGESVLRQASVRLHIISICVNVSTTNVDFWACRLECGSMPARSSLKYDQKIIGTFLYHLDAG